MISIPNPFSGVVYDSSKSDQLISRSTFARLSIGHSRTKVIRTDDRWCGWARSEVAQVGPAHAAIRAREHARVA